MDVLRLSRRVANHQRTEGSPGTKNRSLFLTDNVRDKVKGLELGANDYLIKHFTRSWFACRTLLRRALAGRNSLHHRPTGR